MHRHVLMLILIGFVLLPVGAWAHEKTVMYDREKPIKITVRPGRFVQLHFDTVIVDANSTLPAEHVMYIVPKGREHVLELEGLSKDLNGPLYVTTADDHVYRFWLVTSGHDSGKIHVRDSIKEAKRVAAERVQRQPSGIDPATVNLRRMWYAQWGLSAPGVSIRPMRVETIDEKTGVEVVTTHRFQMNGLYGFNQHIFNRGDRPVEFDPREFNVPEGEARPVTVSFSRHQPGLRSDQSPYVLEPGASVILHLTYEGVRHATIRTTPTR